MTLRWLRPGSLAAITLALCLVAGPRSFAASAPDPILHKPAPEFLRRSLDGKTIDVDAYRGRVVLLTFWATWCAPCQIEMPHFVAWQKRYGSRGLQILAVSMDDEEGPVRAMVAARRLNYPVIMGDEKLGILYGGILGLPVTLLIDRHGDVAAMFKDGASLQQIEHEVRRLLAER